MNDLSTIRKHLGTIRQIAGELMLSSEDGGLRSGYPSIRTIAGDALAALSRLEASAGEPVAAFGEDTDYICDLLMQLHGEFYGKGKAHADAFRSLPKVVAFIKSHPSPSPAPVELSGFDISSIAHTVVPPDTTNDGEPWYTNSQADRNLGASMAIRHITKHYTLYPKQP